MDKLLNKYLNHEEQREFLNIVKSIYEHKEFQKRCTSLFPHHDNMTLGDHMIEVAIFTYIECKKRTDVDLETAVVTAMMHDLYTLPWQNNPENCDTYFWNKHGFRHPLEAVINSVNWFPWIYEKYNSKVIIDGIVHHMFPLPVRVYNDRDMELKTIYSIEGKYEQDLIESCNRSRIGDASFCRSRFKEGRIVSMGDKKSTRLHLTNINCLTASITGRNKNLTN